MEYNFINVILALAILAIASILSARPVRECNWQYGSHAAVLYET